MDGRRRTLLDWAAVIAVAVAVSVAFSLLGVPSPAVFGALVAGLLRALLRPRRLTVPRLAGTGAQAAIGVSVGALVEPDTLRVVGEHWVSVLLVTIGTLVISVLAGQVMRLHPDISAVTGAFSLIAGGAAGVTAMARDLGADERMVAVLQYLRVLVVLAAMPVVATAVYGASAAAGADAGPGAGWPVDLAFTVTCGVVGVVLGRLARMPVGVLLGPMLVAGVLDVTGLSGGAAVPVFVESAAFLAIGLQVGLSFTRDSLRLVGRALPLALVLVAALVAACAGLGAALSATAGVSPLDGYLATTPGGLYAVLATARGSGADATFVLAVQVLRLFVMLFSAPLLARLLRPRAP
jgi:uncharacterized protein